MRRRRRSALGPVRAPRAKAWIGETRRYPITIGIGDWNELLVSGPYNFRGNRTHAFIQKIMKKALMTVETGKDLARRLCRVLDIAKHTLERLATNGYTDSEAPANSLRPEKLISETALLLLAASTAPDDAVRQRIKEVAEILAPHARSERISLGMCLEPALALDYGQAHICLERLGYHDTRFDALLGQSLMSQARSGRERTPYRTLEQEWLLETWMKRRARMCPRVSPTSLLSALNHTMDLVGGSREDVYAFTHALMYVTDFNISPRRLPRSRKAILAEAEAALARCLDEEDYDLAGEVLLAWPLTGKSWSAAAAFALRVLTRVEDRAGFLPAPNTRLRRVEKLRGEQRSAYLLATAYHTVYVMGLLCAAALQSGRTPPSKIPTGNAVSPGCANSILKFLDDGRKVHWRDEFDALSDRERDAIAGLLFNVALRRKIGERQFSAVRELLELGSALGLTDTPASSQAAEMLSRIATFAEMKRDPTPLQRSPLRARAAVLQRMNHVSY